MSEPQTLDLTEPVEQNVEEVVEEVPSSDTAAAEEPAESVEEPVEVPAEEPVESVEEPAEEPAEEPVEEPVEAPVEEPAEEPAEEPVEAPVEAPVAVEQVASEIRNILSDVTPVVETNNLCSLKTLIDVLSQWTGRKIHSSKVEALLHQGTETDENLDNLEKCIEIFKIWANREINLRKNNLFSKINEYSLTTEINISGERSIVLGKLIDLTINCSRRRYKTKQSILAILNNL